MTDSWKQDRKDANRIGRFGVGWVVGIIVGAVLLSGIGWGLTVALSGIKGQGDGVIKKNSAENWTAAQGRFEDLYAEAIAADQKVSINKTALDLNPTDKTLQTNYTGVQSVCLDIVARYNAEARKFLSAEFKSADLPPELGINSNSNCKE